MQLKKVIISLLIMTLFISGQSLTVLADNTQVVSLGADLRLSRKKIFLRNLVFRKMRLI